MSNELECPSCKSFPSSIYDVFMFSSDEDRCETCGLPGVTIREVYRVRKMLADQELQARLEEVLIKYGQAEKRAAQAEYKLRLVESALHEECLP